MLVYVAGPYNGRDHQEIAEHITQAKDIAVQLWAKGQVAICPHLNTAHFEQEARLQHLDNTAYVEADLTILARCDAIVMTPDWRKSPGAKVEHQFCEERQIPIYYYPDLPPLHPTEVARPTQVRAFIDVVMRMYRVHLEKNFDYSPANILATGQVGVVTRLWDKMARLLNLTGFHVEIDADKTHFDAPREPKNESIIDSFLDLANYAVIGLLALLKLWGK